MRPEEWRERTYEERADVREITGVDRVRRCGICPVTSDPAIRREEDEQGPRARYIGVLTCGRVWLCPVCAARRLSERREQIGCALEWGAATEPTRGWHMITLTIRHDATMDPRETIRGVLRAWRRLRQRGTVQRIWRAEVHASIRALEVTRAGKHGWHPHLHVLVWADVSILREEVRDVVERTWAEVVARELRERCVPSTEHGIKWTPNASAEYLASVGLEVSGSGKATGPWHVAHDAAELARMARKLRDHEERARAWVRADRARELWRAYERATRGVRRIELDDRAARMAELGAMARAMRANMGDAVRERAVRDIALPDGALRDLGRIERRGRRAVLAELLAAVEQGEVTCTGDVSAWIMLRSEHGGSRDGPSGHIDRDAIDRGRTTGGERYVGATVSDHG
jgi:hypothetical protein